jgi:two-component system, cell cycle response regulator CtrA
MTLRDDLVLSLEEENERLRERVRLLEEMIGIRIEVPLIFGLSGSEARMFGILFKREMVTKAQAMDVLYSDRADTFEPEIKIVDVFVCKMRKKLARFDIIVETVWGRGYRMPAGSKALANALLEQSRDA